MTRTLIAFASVDGHTRKIAERIAARIRAYGHAVDTVSGREIENCRIPHYNDQDDHDDYDGIIVGSPVRYGKHDRRIIHFLERNADEIGARPNAFFSVNLVARDPAKRSIESNVHVRKFVDALKFVPEHIEIISGRLDYPAYRWLDRLLVRGIMKVTGGPTDPASVIDYTDWAAVDRFAERMARRIEAADPTITR